MNKLMRLWQFYAKKPLIQAQRTQAYYDDLGKLWDKGVSYFNPRTNRTLYTSSRTTHVFNGQLPSNGPISNYSQIGNAREQLKIIHTPYELAVHTRKPNDFGIMNYLTGANSITTRYSTRHFG